MRYTPYTRPIKGSLVQSAVTFDVSGTTSNYGEGSSFGEHVRGMLMAIAESDDAFNRMVSDLVDYIELQQDSLPQRNYSGKTDIAAIMRMLEIKQNLTCDVYNAGLSPYRKDVIYNLKNIADFLKDRDLQKDIFSTEEEVLYWGYAYEYLQEAKEHLTSGKRGNTVSSQHVLKIIPAAETLVVSELQRLSLAYPSIYERLEENFEVPAALIVPLKASPILSVHADAAAFDGRLATDHIAIEN